MDIKHLKLVKMVEEEGSLTKAGDKLFLSQSALSHQLKEMETQLGASVFHRVNKKLVLTSVGKIILQSAHKVLLELDKAKTEVNRIISGDSGTIKVATECYTCYHWLPPVLKQFNQEFPNVEVKIAPESILDPYKKLIKGKIDIGITSNLPQDQQIQYKKLFTDELVAVIPTDHSWRKKKYLRAKDFADQDVLIHSKPLETVTLFNKLLIPAGVQPRKVTAMQLTEATIEMVKAGLGVTVMARWAVRHYLESGQVAVVPVTQKGLHRTWYAIMLMDMDLPPYIHHFVDYLDQEIKL